MGSDRATLVHELTHNLLVRFPLPAWLNEALAMAFERGKKWGRSSLLTLVPREFAKCFSGGCHVILCSAGDVDARRLRCTRDSKYGLHMSNSVETRGTLASAGDKKLWRCRKGSLSLPQP
jgi:hypothetical protein